MQETNKDTEQLGRQSSQKASTSLRSISRGSSGIGNSSRHSFSVSFGVPTGLGVSETTSITDVGVVGSEKDSENPHQKVQIRRLAYLNKPEIPVLLAGTVSAVINGAILPIFGILISNVIKAFYESPHKIRKDSNFWSLIFVVLGAVSLLAFPARTYLFGVAGCRLIKRVRAMCFEKVIHMEVGWFDEPEHSSGIIGARLSTDASTVRGLVGDALAQIVQDTASAAAGLAIAFQASWQLALIILAMIPMIGLNGYVQIKFMKGFSADAKVCMYSYISSFA